MEDRIKNAITASFIADALSLGVHWVYDIAVIKSEYGRLDRMVAPKLAPFHKTKEKGAFTHYGDQAMLLLETIIETGGFELNRFEKAWTSMFQDYSGYMDGATKETLENMARDAESRPAGSMSSDLGGAARITPLSLLFNQGQDNMVSAAADQTAMTHNQPAVIETARFFARVGWLVLDGKEPVAAMIESVEFIKDVPNVKEMILIGLESRSDETTPVIKRFGQMCSVEGALPSTIHLIAKYESDLKTALIENIMAGGDSSARGLLTGFILGAHMGLGQIPKEWTQEMLAYERINNLIDQWS